MSDMTQTKRVRTTCSYCGVGCGIVVEKNDTGLTLEGDTNHPVNQGRLCSKGRNLHHVAMDHSDRLLYPEMRLSRQSPRMRVDWNTAMRRAAAVFQSVIRRYGPGSVGFYVSGQLLTEEYYIVNKLVKGFLGTSNIDTNSRLCMSTAVVAYKKSLGEDSVPVSYEDIDLCEVFFIAGANPAWCHPILFQRIEDRKARHPETRVIVVDPRRTESCELADLHLQIRPGTDVTLYNAIARRLIETGQIDMRFIEAHTDGFDALKEKVFERTVDEAAAICGVRSEHIELAAGWIGEARSFLTLWAMGLNQSSIGVNKNLALINLNLITGHIGRPGSGPFSLTGQPNAMGGREVGGLATMLAAHRDLSRPDHRAEVAAHWGVPAELIPSKPGLTAVEMFEALRSDKLKAIWIVCTNPSVSLPDATMVDEALERARFVVVQDISNKSDTLQYADLILPAAGWLEKEGTMTNSDRRISYLPHLLDPPGEALPDAEIFARFAEAMGYGDHFPYFRSGPSASSEAGTISSNAGAADIYDEHAALTRGTNLDISGLDYDRLKQTTMQWPVPDRNHPGTKRLFADGRFYTDSGRAKIFPCDDGNTSEATDPDYPLILTTGRIRDQWHTMTRTGKVRRLSQHIGRPMIEINEVDAMRSDIRENDLVQIDGRRGSLRLRAKISDSVPPGVLFAPMHWGKIGRSEKARANNVTNPLFDPSSKEPDFKFTAVNIRKHRPNPRRIVIVGAGTAAHAFLETHSGESNDDTITVLSREPDPFYNRILLPDFIHGNKSFEQLRYATDSFARVNVLSGVSAQSIDRANRIVRTDAGEIAYDVLVLATGSRPRRHRLMEPDAKRSVFTLRNRIDAENIKSQAGNNVLIIGGGLLGIELADALLQSGSSVTIVHRSARLMSRQLDATAADMLCSGLLRRGMQIMLNDEVIGLFKRDDIFTAYLASGRRLDCSSVVYALGTQPDIELARSAGLRTNFGVVVDEYMQTSDPNVYAIGEAMEFNRNTYGTALAAADHAKVLAGVLAGDPTVRYGGSIDLNILKVEGLPCVSMGRIHPGKEDEVILLNDEAQGLYKKFLINRDRLVGCLLFGDTSDLSRMRDLYESQIELGEERKTLIGNAGPAREVRGALVCSCNRVGAENLREAIIEGSITDLQELCRITGAGTGCGSCRSEVQRLLNKEIKEPAVVS